MFERRLEANGGLLRSFPSMLFQSRAALSPIEEAPDCRKLLFREKNRLLSSVAEKWLKRQAVLQALQGFRVCGGWLISFTLEYFTTGPRHDAKKKTMWRLLATVQV